jgi:hypothetical protein
MKKIAYKCEKDFLVVISFSPHIPLITIPIGIQNPDITTHDRIIGFCMIFACKIRGLFNIKRQSNHLGEDRVSVFAENPIVQISHDGDFWLYFMEWKGGGK